MARQRLGSVTTIFTKAGEKWLGKYMITLANGRIVRRSKMLGLVCSTTKEEAHEKTKALMEAEQGQIVALQPFLPKRSSGLLQHRVGTKTGNAVSLLLASCDLLLQALQVYLPMGQSLIHRDLLVAMDDKWECWRIRAKAGRQEDNNGQIYCNTEMDIGKFDILAVAVNGHIYYRKASDIKNLRHPFSDVPPESMAQFLSITGAQGKVS